MKRYCNLIEINEKVSIGWYMVVDGMAKPDLGNPCPTLQRNTITMRAALRNSIKTQLLITKTGLVRCQPGVYATAIMTESQKFGHFTTTAVLRSLVVGTAQIALC
ncbi:hypothetical protein CEXT_734011 [Caerostris extrusa]|uniref:Uncharacterized protein n=1 Tax=Caerostris extrusa TaxID=172846 RepID=A0AAV4XG91_CAEEX|nr:hypothetical protein CEXT_734011 [Caerostris extrusa]